MSTSATTPRRTILVAEDEESIRFGIERFLVARGYDVIAADSATAAIESCENARPDAAVLDYSLPDGDGLMLLARLRAIDPNLPVLILTAHASIDLAVRAIKEGADQFLTKPVELPALLLIIERLFEHQRDRQASLLRKKHQVRRTLDPFLGESPAIRKLAEQARRVLASPSPVLVLGETGSGKGLLANWLHLNGSRADEAFVDLNCAGLAREFLETELFGHEKGAFTGAVAAKAGLLEIAHRGTLFLDEIGDVDLQVQPKLLKVLEDKRFRRLGDVRDRQVDLRLIAATHHDLPRAVSESRFRGDLYYRISTLPLRVPPLRERGHDVTLVARTLLTGIAAELGRGSVRLAAEAEQAIERYPWPGNVRELRNVLERATLHGGDVLSAADLAEGLNLGQPVAPTARLGSLHEAERRHIQAVLTSEQGNVPAAAAVLGLSRSALYQRLRKHGIVPGGLPNA
jgi:DNA-binding NtrC family response regulator